MKIEKISNKIAGEEQTKNLFVFMLILMFDERVKHVALKTNEICGNHIYILTGETEKVKFQEKK
jgi:hypothetical protein